MSGSRFFVAVVLTQSIRARLQQTRAALVQRAPSWKNEKWVADHNLHLTLRFLGGLDEISRSEIRAMLDDELRAQLPFELCLGGVLAVPNPRRCSMLWALFSDPDRACADLAARVERAAVHHGVDPESRPFTPHVTLVRARRPKKLADEAQSKARAVLATPPISMSVLSATLFSSALTGAGPVYEAIDSWAFTAPRQTASQ